MGPARIVLIALIAALALAPAASARKAYVTRGDQVTVVDTESNWVFAPDGLTGLAGASSVVFAPDARSAYVSTNSSAGILVVDTFTEAVVDTIETGPGTTPDELALNPDGTRLYAVNGSEVIAIDTAGRSVVTTLPGIGGVGGIAVSPDGTRLYVADQGTADVREYDTATHAPTLRSPFDAPVGPSSLGVTPDGETLISSNNGATAGDPQAYLFALGDGARRDVAAPDDFPRDVAVTPDGTRAYQAGGGGSLFLSVIDLAGGTRTGQVTLDAQPSEVALGPDGTRAYVTTTLGELKVVDTTTDTVIASPAVGGGQRDVAVAPNPGPVAQFGVSHVPVAGQRTSFSAYGSFDDDGIARYEWDFGDGTTAVTAERGIDHHFERPGDYDVTLTVVDTQGVSTQRVFTGKQLLVAGSPAARQTRRVTVPALTQPERPQQDGMGPVVDVRRPRNDRTYRARKLRRIRGSAEDRGAPLVTGVARVRASLVRRGRGRGCRVLRRSGRLTRSRTCAPALGLRPKGTTAWTLRLRRRLPRGRYTLTVRAFDVAENRGPRKYVRFRIR